MHVRTNWFIIVKRVILHKYNVLVFEWWITKVPWSIIEEGGAKSTLQFNNTNSSLHVLPSDAATLIKFACIKISHTSSTRERHNVL